MKQASRSVALSHRHMKRCSVMLRRFAVFCVVLVCRRTDRKLTTHNGSVRQHGGATNGATQLWRGAAHSLVHCRLPHGEKSTPGRRSGLWWAIWPRSSASACASRVWQAGDRDKQPLTCSLSAVCLIFRTTNEASRLYKIFAAIDEDGSGYVLPTPLSCPVALPRSRVRPFHPSVKLVSGSFSITWTLTAPPLPSAPLVFSMPTTCVQAVCALQCCAVRPVTTLCELAVISPGKSTLRSLRAACGTTARLRNRR